MIRILIADDHAIVRKGLRQIILENYPFAKIEETNDAEELIVKAAKGKWDVVICDLNMPGRSGLEALHQIHQFAPQLPVLIMSIYPEEQYAVRVIKAGASGYLSKESIHDHLNNAIQTVLRGKKYITPSVADLLASSISDDKGRLPHEALSDREFDVFKLLASGKKVSDIAQQLSLSITTVSTYRSRIMDKMNMHSNSELTRYAIEHGLL